jgi:DNA-directed RNA polymerase subunit A'
MRGITISVRDFYITDEMRKEREKLIETVKSNAEVVMKNYKDGKLEAQPGYTVKETYKMLLLAELDSARDLAVSIVNKHFNYTNNLFLMSEVHVRGDIRTIVQTSLLLGQQNVRADRPTRGYSGRAIPYIAKNDDAPESKGFIKDSFFDGLEPTELYLHAMGARASMQSKSLITAVSGYLMRRLINAMQDFYVEKDMSVRGAGGALLQTIYGGDGIDPMMAGAAAAAKKRK